MLKAFEDMRLEGQIESILELLGELGQVPQSIVELIRAEDDTSVLSRWFAIIVPYAFTLLL